MSDFTVFLQQYMEENEITPAELARELNMERSTVFRYIKGTRIPSDEKIVWQIAEALRMAMPDKKALVEAYDRISLGEQVVNSYHCVRTMFQTMKQRKEQMETGIPQHVLRDALWKRGQNVHLKSKKEIEWYIAALFLRLREQNGGRETLHLLMQPFYHEVQESLISVFGGTEQKIEQIICLEQRFDKSYENMDVFRTILPMCFADLQYEVRYYYEFMTHHINKLSWMPNVIAAGACVLQFDYEMTCGIFIWDENYARAVQNQYQKLHALTEPFLVQQDGKTADASRQSETRREAEESGEEDAAIMMCRRPFTEYCNEDYWKGMIYCGDRKRKLFHCFEKASMLEFMETGRNGCFPKENAESFRPEERIRMIRRMIRLMQDEIVICCMLKESIDLPEDFCFCWGGKNAPYLSVKLIKEDRNVEILIKDKGMCQIFRQFLEYLEKKGWLYSQKESLAFLMETEKKYVSK